MGISRRRALDYADTLLERPRGEIPLTLKRSKGGATLLHKGRAVTKCHGSRVGFLQATYMARALGVGLPPEGGKVRVKVSSGVLYRVVGISSLDLRLPEARELAAQMLATAEMQRSASGMTI